jgi:hypothetical protein
VQSRFNCGSLNGLAKVFAAQLKPMAEALHSRTRRRKIKEHIAAAKSEGDLSAMLVAANALVGDESYGKNFRRAAAQHVALQTEIEEMGADDGAAERMGKFVGERAATVLSLVIFGLSAALTVIGIGP